MANVGLQLYTVRDACGGNLATAIEAVAAIGYRYVELAGLGGLDAQQLRQVLDGVAVQAVSAHVAMERIRREFSQVARELQVLGCRYVTIPAPPSNVGHTEGSWRFFREELRFYADQFRHFGLQLAYHNHAREFEPLEEGTRPVDILFESTEPYEQQLDVYWAQFAGLDPAVFLSSTPARCTTLHVKDLADSPAGSDTIVGAGVLDWRAILGSALRRGVRYFFVEVDNPGDKALELVAQGYRYLHENFADLFCELA
ncbi:MAG: sugar phosphate isomerase/epimerase family protein [Candidatus Sumerlaeaceae bacterium]